MSGSVLWGHAVRADKNTAARTASDNRSVQRAAQSGGAIDWPNGKHLQGTLDAIGRVHELERILRNAVACYDKWGVMAEPDEWLWNAREALGLNGADGTTR